MSCNMNQYVKIILKDQSASWNTKQLYRSEIYFIRKHSQPWSENIKYHLASSYTPFFFFFFEDFTTVLDFIS